jgi:hypothetical protein
MRKVIMNLNEASITNRKSSPQSILKMVPDLFSRSNKSRLFLDHGVAGRRSKRPGNLHESVIIICLQLQKVLGFT